MLSNLLFSTGPAPCLPCRTCRFLSLDFSLDGIAISSLITIALVPWPGRCVIDSVKEMLLDCRQCRRAKASFIDDEVLHGSYSNRLIYSLRTLWVHSAKFRSCMSARSGQIEDVHWKLKHFHHHRPDRIVSCLASPHLIYFLIDVLCRERNHPLNSILLDS